MKVFDQYVTSTMKHFVNVDPIAPSSLLVGIQPIRSK